MIVLLVMLVVVTLLALSSVRSTTMDERMAGNARDRDKAFQAAEAAVQNCLAQVDGSSFPAANVVAPVAADAGDPTPNWERPDVWTNSGVEVNTGDDSLNSQPRCIVENLGSGSYRVTGRAFGGAQTTEVVLQATYSKE